jgi:hypothetical protein
LHDANEGDRLATLLDEIGEEFPKFRLIRKDQSRFQRAIHYALVALTFGRMRQFLSGYQTTIGNTIYVTDDWEDRDRDDRYIILCHERIHLRQFRKFTLPGMALLYLLLPLPMGISYFRAHFEKQAYEESIRASVEVYGMERVEDNCYRSYILEQFTSASYGWMWPFRRHLNSWYDSVLVRLADRETDAT